MNSPRSQNIILSLRIYIQRKGERIPSSIFRQNESAASRKMHLFQIHQADFNMISVYRFQVGCNNKITEYIKTLCRNYPSLLTLYNITKSC